MCTTLNENIFQDTNPGYYRLSRKTATYSMVADTSADSRKC